MPLYTYQCEECDKRFEQVHPMGKSSAQQLCPCGGWGFRIIMPTRIIRDAADYQCPVTGKLISGRAAHEENLKRTGSRVYEPSEKGIMLKNKAKGEAQFDKSIEDSVERQFDAMPSAKKERLSNELLSGADVAVVRG